MSWSDTPELEIADWQSRFGGLEWRYDAEGVFVRDGEGEEGPARTPGEPITARRITELFAEPLKAVSVRFELPPELLVMTVATEAGSFRSVGYTGPATFRWEPGARVRDVEPSFYGDYSFGPMQTLASTARQALRGFDLPDDRFNLFPVFTSRPNLAPDDLPGYDPELSLTAGAAVLAGALSRTGHNPILAAAVYNSGGLYDASSPTSRFHNRWHLRSWGNHLDRASRWFGDACHVVGQLRLKDAAEIDPLEENLTGDSDFIRP